MGRTENTLDPQLLGRRMTAVLVRSKLLERPPCSGPSGARAPPGGLFPASCGTVLTLLQSFLLTRVVWSGLFPLFMLGQGAFDFSAHDSDARTRKRGVVNAVFEQVMHIKPSMAIFPLGA